MSYRVVFRERVANGLHTLRFLAHELGRDAGPLTRAVAEITARLSADPANEGESRAGAERVLIVNPLTVFYEVFEDAAVVLIYSGVYHPRHRL